MKKNFESFLDLLFVSILEEEIISTLRGAIIVVAALKMRLSHDTSTFSRTLRRMLCSSEAVVVLYWIWINKTYNLSILHMEKAGGLLY